MDLVTLAPWALVAAVGAPWLAAIFSFALGEGRDGTRTAVGLTLAAIASIGAIVVGVAATGSADGLSIGIPLLGTSFGLTVDRMGAVFAVVATVLWFATTIYANGYLSHAKDRARFFGFFAICVGSAVGIALSSNLLTLFVFYEALTLATYPLVVHNGTAKAQAGGRTYLIYALTGGALLALGVIWLYMIGGGADFASGGSLPAGMVAEYGGQLVIIFALLMAGFGVKAALFPAHGWLPKAMVAPAPVSALLHAVAVVKAGVFGIGRVVLDLFGVEVTWELGVALPLAIVAGFTIIFGSVRALMQDDIKKRLAYSTIAQLSYIVIGFAIGTPVAAAAALAHLAHHAFLKITMFFTAGAVAEELHIYKVSELDGAGRRMPMTMTAFTVAALGIIGIPPIAGFASKWGLGIGALQQGEWWVVAVLSVSTVLTAAYFLPMIGRIWFRAPRAEWAQTARPEGDRRLVWPIVFAGVVGAAIGPLAGASWAPLAYSAGAIGVAREAVLPWVEGQFLLDATAGWFLLLAGVAWAAAAIGSARSVTENRTRYWVFFALSALGSAGVAMAVAPAAFYASFSVMALSAFGLVAHPGTERSARASRTYLAFTVVAEAFLLAGLMIGSAGEGTFATNLIGSPLFAAGMVLLLLAFGTKVGAIGIHGWMPVAYGATPPGAAAAVAGVVSSAGILGMIRFLPGGHEAVAPWGLALMTLGIIAALYGALMGVLQKDARVLLGYSSMSQFGLMTVGVGAGLATATVWPAAIAAASVYLVHHGLAKAALFAASDAQLVLGPKRWLAAVAVLPALALTGLPLFSGAIAKVALKGVVHDAPSAWAHAFDVLLPIAAVGTTLLVARFLVLTFAGGGAPAGTAAAGSSTATTSATTQAESCTIQSCDPCIPRAAVASLALLVAFVLGSLWLAPVDSVAYAAKKSLTGEYLWVLTWPALVGVAISAVAWLLRSTALARILGSVQPGDFWAPVFRAVDTRWVAYQAWLAAPEAPAVTEVAAAEPSLDPLDLPRRIERTVLSWDFSGAAVLGLLVLVLTLSLLA